MTSKLYQLPRTVRGVPAAMAERIRALGAELNPSVVDQTRDLYTALHDTLPQPPVQILSDIAYGPDARQRLDLHKPAQAAAGPLPVVIYVHGGGFVAGDKNTPNSRIYGNVASFFASHGCIGINATYRLAPGTVWPGAAQDVGAMLAWARAHAAAHGGDPARIYLLGQSAGATHVATYAFRPELHPADGPGLAGVILMSGPYDLQAGKISPGAAAYFGSDATLYPQRRVLGHLQRTDFPVFITVAEFDPMPFQRSALELSLALLTLTGRAPRFRQSLGHNHVSPAFSFGTDDHTVSHEVLDFVLGQRP